MELDLLAAAETESDSESNHSNQDNASGRRSVVTAATAGSEAGMSSPENGAGLRLLEGGVRVGSGSCCVLFLLFLHCSCQSAFVSSVMD